jgi:hypothetical protein
MAHDATETILDAHDLGHGVRRSGCAKSQKENSGLFANLLRALRMLDATSGVPSVHARLSWSRRVLLV